METLIKGGFMDKVIMLGIFIVYAWLMVLLIGCSKDTEEEGIIEEGIVYECYSQELNSCAKHETLNLSAKEKKLVLSELPPYPVTTKVFKKCHDKSVRKCYL